MISSELAERYGSHVLILAIGGWVMISMGGAL